MHILDAPPRFLFFTGKGGVGKTSIACAVAVHLAESGARVLLVSTDPASNVGQVFGLAIGNHVTPVPSVALLSALELNPEEIAFAYRENIVAPVRGVLSAEAISGIEEQLSGACTTEIASFDAFTALLTSESLNQEFDHVVFDTAPTGHTIRLLQLPGAWSAFLEDGKGDASCLGPLAGLQKQQSQYREAVTALADPSRTRVVLVARAQVAALCEAGRTYSELSDIGIEQLHLVVNAMLPENEALQDPVAAAMLRRETAAMSEIPEELRALPTDRIALKPFNLVGLEALRALVDERVSIATALLGGASFIAPQLSSLVSDLAQEDHGLIMLMGKGGVGKTTLASAIAVGLAQRGLPVLLTTSDPAAHLNETLAGTLDNLSVGRIDPHVETQRYRQHVLATKGAMLDSQSRSLLEEDLRSPCTEEIAVFQAFSRLIRDAGKKFVVMDTAPTGHTLLLLDATGAYHREIARQMDGTGVHYTTPLMDLQNPAKTKVIVVTLAETTPVLEAASLQSELRRAGINPWAWIVNASVAAASTSSPLLQQRARNELTEIETVACEHSPRYAVVPLLSEEPTGIQRLSDLVVAPLDQNTLLIAAPLLNSSDLTITPTGQGALS